MLTSQYFEKVFVCGSVILFLFCCCIYLYVLYLYNLFHILLLPLQTYGSMECTYICNEILDLINISVFSIVHRNTGKGNKVFLKMNVEQFFWVTSCIGINQF
jgi:hypothetical protein